MHVFGFLLFLLNFLFSFSSHFIREKNFFSLKSTFEFCNALIFIFNFFLPIAAEFIHLCLRLLVSATQALGYHGEQVLPVAAGLPAQRAAKGPDDAALRWLQRGR